MLLTHQKKIVTYACVRVYGEKSIQNRFWFMCNAQLQNIEDNENE